MPIRARTKPRQYHHGRLKEALVRSARAILEKEGLEALSLRETARRAGVSQAAPYHHFADKQALLAAVATKGFEELTLAMQSRMEREANALARFSATGVGYVSFATRNPALFSLMFAGGVCMWLATDNADLARAGAAAYNVLVEGARGVLESERRPESDLPLVSLTAWSIVHGLSKLILEAGRSPAEYGFKTAEALSAAVLARTAKGGKLSY